MEDEEKRRWTTRKKGVTDNESLPSAPMSDEGGTPGDWGEGYSDPQGDEGGTGEQGESSEGGEAEAP